MKKTPWFDLRVKPVHVGVYQRRFPAEVRFCYWTGSKWAWNSDTPENAFRNRRCISNAWLPWRGLAEPPKEKK